jgi:pyrimidine operon attenuation protein/uracil phosphoribosyltransferase
MDAAAVRRAIARLAGRIAARYAPATPLGLIGIKTRGEHLARRFQALLRDRHALDAPVGALDITIYRDDLHALREQIVVGATSIGFDLANRHLVLVDDVLFTGRSVRAGIDAIMDMGRPRTVALAVLVDRGHRELPIHPDFVGKVVRTARAEEVEVRLVEVDGRDEVRLVTPGNRQAARGPMHG